MQRESKNNDEFSRSKFYFNSEGSAFDKRGSEPNKSKTLNQQQLLMNFDQMFHTKKQNKETCSVSPKSQYFKSEYSPFRSPESQTQSTRSKSNLRNSRIDLLYDLENYNGPKLSLDKDVAINEFCIDHPDKKSKFYITNGIFSKDFGDSKLNRGFCSKCSVQVAMKGFTLEEVIKEDEFDRKIRIDNFLEFLNTTEEKEVRRLQNIISAMNGTSSYLNNQIKRMEQAFAGVFKSLELKRKKVMGELKANQKHNKNCFAELSELINVKLKTIDAMKKDIDSNLDKIISRIDKEPFNQIITNYELNILNLESQILEAGQLKGLTFASEDGKDKLARLVNDLFQLKSFKIVEIKKDFQPVIEILGELEPFSSFDKRDAGSFLINDQKGSCENSSRSGDEENEGTFSQNVPSRITMQRDESSFSKSHQFNYQLYKQSPKNQTENSHKSISGAVTSIIHNNIREGKDQFLQNQAGGNRKRIKGKSAATLSFDNRHIVTLHKKASDIEE